MNPDLIKKKVGEMAGFIRSDPRQGNAIRNLHQILLKADSLLRGMAGFPPVCEKGCDACCYRIPVIHSKIEEAYVEKGVKENFIRTKTKVFAAIQADETWSALRQEFGLPALRPEEESASFDGAWEEIGGPCPMLEDGVCLIHERRPIECRLILSPYPCQRPFSHVNPSFSIEPSLTLDGALDQAEQTLESLEKKGARYEKRVGFLKGIVDLCKQIDVWVYGSEGGSTPLPKILRRVL